MHRTTKRYSRLIRYNISLFFLLLGSLLLVGCGESTSTGAVMAPTPTLVISQNAMNDNLSPTPTPLPFTCGAWITQPTIPVGTSIIGVNAKFTRLVNGNPQGIGDATATATVYWGDQTTDSLSVQTTADGLAVFRIQATNHNNAVNKESLVTVHFEKAGVAACDVDTSRAAFFTLIMVTPTPGNNNNNNNKHKRHHG